VGLDLAKLEKVRHRGSNTIARCPACAEAGSDRKGEHLFINDCGQFGCVLYPGADGQQHRKRIFELTGVKEKPNKHFEVKNPPSPLIAGHKIIQKDILGHLGHIESTHARKNLENHLSGDIDNTQNDCHEADPSVPKLEPQSLNKNIFTPDEERLLTGIDAESLEKVRRIKEIFNGTVVAVKDNNSANKEISR
jgi:hypothetical protein